MKDLGKLGKQVLGGLIVLLLLFMVLGCPGPGPKPEPTPTPTPTPPGAPKGTPLKPEMLARQQAGRLYTLEGKPLEIVMAVECCKPLPEAAAPSRWPLASKGWMDFTKPYGFNAYHFRLGPFYTGPDQESAWADTGGPFEGGPGSAFNQKFWDEVRGLAYHALERGHYVEVNTIDTWYCKHAASNWGDQQMPWPQSDIDKCGIEWTPTHQAYVRKVVEELGCYGNVIWLLDNEGSQISGTRREWYEKHRDAIRAAEAEVGCGFAHIIGTNSGFNDVADYVVLHDKGALTGPVEGRWTLNNERNPVTNPQQEIDFFSTAREAGQSWAFWRAEMSEEQMLKVMEGFREVLGGAAPPAGCYAPDENDPAWASKPEPIRPCQKCGAVNAAKQRMPNPCGQPPPDSLERFAAELRASGECAGKTSDAVSILAPDGLWEEHHVIAYTDGCYTNTQNGFKNVWRYNGPPPANPNPPGGCTAPLPPGVGAWGGPKPHNRWWDATPLVAERSYCDAIEMPGRNTCPARSECPGYKCEERVECEKILLKGEKAVWRSDGTVVVNPDNLLGLQARCTECTWLEVCDALGQNCKRVEVR